MPVIPVVSLMYSKLGDYIYDQRVRKGYMIHDIVSKLGVSPEYYNSIERGSTRPSYTIFMRLVDILDLDMVTCRVLIGKEMTQDEA